MNLLEFLGLITLYAVLSDGIHEGYSSVVSSILYFFLKLYILINFYCEMYLPSYNPRKKESDTITKN